MVGVNRFVRRRQPRRRAVGVPHRPGDRAAADRARARRARRPQRARTGARRSTAVERAARGRRQPGAADHRRRRSARHARRDRRHAAQRVRRASATSDRPLSGHAAARRPASDRHLRRRAPPSGGRRCQLPVAPGETLGLVGESGSGKSVTAFSILRLLQPPGRITGGRVLFEGRDLLALTEREMRAVRGARISLIFQEPMTALNPVMRVGDQIAEALHRPRHGRGAEARARAVELLDAVRIPDAGAARARLSASAVGRHAAARDDRHRPGLPAAARHRRRADDGARRHDPGAGPRSAARAARRASTWRCCSSRTTSASSPRWPTAWR